MRDSLLCCILKRARPPVGRGTACTRSVAALSQHWRPQILKTTMEGCPHRHDTPIWPELYPSDSSATCRQKPFTRKRGNAVWLPSSDINQTKCTISKVDMIPGRKIPKLWTGDTRQQVYFGSEPGRQKVVTSLQAPGQSDTSNGFLVSYSVSSPSCNCHTNHL